MTFSYSVDLELAAKVVASLSTVDEQLSEVVVDLRWRVARLHETWAGTAAAAHLEAHEGWCASYAEMHDALLAMRRALARRRRQLLRRSLGELVDVGCGPVILIDAAPMVDASSSFEHGNQGAALVHDTLLRRLSGCGAMAGDASSRRSSPRPTTTPPPPVSPRSATWSTPSRRAAGSPSASLDNHGRAENRSLISGRTVFTATPCVAGFVTVLPCSLPPSLGGDLSGLPSWASWILDQVEGFVWPDADTARLREAASAWRDASFQVEDLSAYCRSAIRSFSLLRSPEVPVAVDVTSGLAERCRAVGEQCAVLARACDTYADHVDEQRAAVLDLVHDLLRDAVIIQGVGIVLGVVTGGATAAGATALNAARIAAAAPRLLRIISTLRTLASTCAAPLRLASSALRDVRLELAVFRRARITVASAYKAERVARVERLRGLLREPRLFDPHELRGLSKADVESLCKGWPVRDSSRGEGIVHVDPLRSGRQIRIMDGYPPGTRPDPITEGPYAVISQGNGPAIKVPLLGNPVL